MCGCDILNPQSLQFQLPNDSEYAEILESPGDAKVIRLLSLLLVAPDGATSFWFGDGEDNPLTPELVLPENGQLILPFSQVGYFDTPAGSGLWLTQDDSDKHDIFGLARYTVIG